ncbi:uncharacterized protein EI90DRAFT_1313898 [Cantharellus anzutake]|uniref:uncharacterized protein n=1 Tax=Cantharellus anzutake TaxID=1750568 RepID=UPI0019052D2F|nr:uncharacterized protein EI90DRAFT_1313898 [Cantharellus anzutake]KAF8342200.1 hypothetical protein EI90DRAFT_1313898 [Cantharellus anzutake]
MRFKRGGCPLSNALTPCTWPQNLTKSTTAPEYVMVGYGTQNYTCSSSGAYSPAGAVAKLYDVSCMASTPKLETVPQLVYDFIETNPTGRTPLAGLDLSRPSIHHYFVNNGAGGINPRFDLEPNGALVAFSVMKKVQDVPDPENSKGNVDWLLLQNVNGTLAKSIYRVSTYFGQPPKSTCTSGPADVTIPYAALYYFYTT